MANEILVYDITAEPGSRRNPTPGRRIDLLFYYLIVSRYQDANRVDVVPTPASELPDVVISRSLLTSGELAALDVGDAHFALDNVIQADGETDQQMLMRGRAAYASRRIEAQTEFALRWHAQGIGFRVNAGGS